MGWRSLSLLVFLCRALPYRKPKTLTGACKSVDGSTCERPLQGHLWRLLDPSAQLLGTTPSYPRRSIQPPDRPLRSLPLRNRRPRGPGEIREDDPERRQAIWNQGSPTAHVTRECPRRAAPPRRVTNSRRLVVLPADSDDLARVYRFDLAQDSEMISPTIPI